MSSAPPPAERDQLLRQFGECALAQPPRNAEANWLVLIKLAEWDELRDHFGSTNCLPMMRAVADLAVSEVPDGEWTLSEFDGEIILVVRGRSEADLGRQLSSFARMAVRREFMLNGEEVRLTPAVGMAALAGELISRSGLRCAHAALEHSLAHLDLRPIAFSNLLDKPSLVQRRMRRLGLRKLAVFTLQLLLAMLLALGLPLGIYVLLNDSAAMLLSSIMFVTTVLMLVVTATIINVENILSLRDPHPPDEPASPCPPATALVAAYLPNEAAIVPATIEAMLAMDYPGPLQVVLAYNTPHDMPVEQLLREMAERDPRFVPLRVPDSQSKAQNINAALSVVSGDFVGIFDADHRPQPGSFERAWRWLSNGVDVVQGHCVIRNGPATFLSRLIAVEFEQIYAVAHPGSARLRGYAIFGGSNGYWRSEVLREIRMRRTMMTEDIDSSLRAIREGRRIVSDRGIISTELAPVTLRRLSHQRLRWAQGWFQVSLRHLRLLLKSPNLTLRQKIGTFYLLAWREIFPWMSLQVFPVIIFWAMRAGSLDEINWKVPILVSATIYVLSTGPLQTMTALFNSAPAIRRESVWFAIHLLLSNFYSEFLTMLTRVAHIRQMLGENEWRVTPRTSESDSPWPSPDLDPSADTEPQHWPDAPPPRAIPGTGARRPIGDSDARLARFARRSGLL